MMPPQWQPTLRKQDKETGLESEVGWQNDCLNIHIAQPSPVQRNNCKVRATENLKLKWYD